MSSCWGERTGRSSARPGLDLAGGQSASLTGRLRWCLPHFFWISLPRRPLMQVLGAGEFQARESPGGSNRRSLGIRIHPVPTLG